MKNIIKEACVGNLNEAIKAEKQGADRLELCAELHLGGHYPFRRTYPAGKTAGTYPPADNDQAPRG